MNIEGRTDNSKSVVSLLNGQGKSAVLIVCEHASNHIPSKYADLGLSKDVLQSHIAWDPGAHKVALHLSKLLDSPYVKGEISRLVYDCNRSPNAASAMPEKSEKYDIPGNAGLSSAERNNRINDIYLPFEKCLADTFTAFKQPPAFITIHSFTGNFLDKPREVELGILHDKDTRLADAMLAVAGKHTQLVTRRNEPYGPQHDVTHTLTTHAMPSKVPNVMIEIRNDLITTDEECEQVAFMLHKIISEALLAIGHTKGSSIQNKEQAS